MDESVTLTIGRAEALILFDLLFGFRDQQQLLIRDDAQRVTLWMLEACLEKSLAEPFAPDYGRLLEEARQSVVARWGRPTTPPAASA